MLVFGEVTEEFKKSMEFSQIYAEAYGAGQKAGQEAIPVPIVIGSPTTVFGNDIDFSKETFYVSEGVCGFASIRFAGNTAFGRWAKKVGIAKKAYGGGLYISVREFGQSLTRKEACAYAFAEVLRKYEIDAWVDSRLD